MVVTTGARCRGSTGMSAEIRDVAKLPTIDRTAPHNNKDLAQNVSSVKAEKFCSEVRVLGPACTLEIPKTWAPA